MSSQINENTCLLGCRRIALHRGMCRPCYQLACLAVKAGKTTWEREIAAGRATHAKKSSISHFFKKI